uniref:Uncharacterized protein n=1 Tax=Mimivirus LCMiAC01 TaxID=2506608 RepID=A0A481Z0F8_9VIRU|nr:MAG: hypothetical protein LCMiAC01_02240 [Mimivirus LCMiAC01]
MNKRYMLLLLCVIFIQANCWVWTTCNGNIQLGARCSGYATLPVQNHLYIPNLHAPNTLPIWTDGRGWDINKPLFPPQPAVPFFGQNNRQNDWFKKFSNKLGYQ